MRHTLKEAWSENPSRRTETEYEALPTGASGQLTAKPLRPKGGGVDSAVVDGRHGLLPGEVSPYARKGDVERSEKSAEAVVSGPKGQEKGRIERRAKQP